MSLNRPTRSIRLLHTDRTSEDRLRDKRRSSHATIKQINEKKKLFSNNVSLVSFGRKCITNLIHLIGATRPKFDV